MAISGAPGCPGCPCICVVLLAAAQALGEGIEAQTTRAAWWGGREGWAESSASQSLGVGWYMAGSTCIYARARSGGMGEPW